MTALALLCLGWASAAWAAFMIPGQPIRPKDFTIVKRDGVYHLFYIRNNISVPAAQSELDFGHAISTDYYHWTQLPPVMRVDSLGWDNAHVWAPHVIERDGLYWMFYTGVQYVPGQYNYVQRTGLAVSSDLMTWTRQGLVFDNSEVPWAWWNPAKQLPAHRDPFVMADPEVPGRWLMYYTASPLADSNVTMIGVAESNGDFAQWADLKPLWITYQTFSFNTLTESPHLFEHAGLWYMVITTNAGQPLSLYTALSPTGDHSEWTYRGRLRNMLGYDTNSWFASESFRDGTHDLFAFIQGDRVEIREILWGTSWQFALVQPPLFHIVRMTWAQPEVEHGEPTSLRFDVANPWAGYAQLEAWRVDALGNDDSKIPMEQLGILETPLFDSDSLTYYWIARHVPRFPGDTAAMRVVLRASDRTAASGMLTVRASSAPPDTTPPDPPGGGDGDEGPEPADWLGDRAFSARALASTPLGRGPALAIELAGEADVRVDLFDVLGRRVRNLAWRRMAKGVTVLPWDGRGDDGAACARGMYFARVQSGDRVTTARILLLAR